MKLPRRIAQQLEAAQDGALGDSPFQLLNLTRVLGDRDELGRQEEVTRGQTRQRANASAPTIWPLRSETMG